MEFLYTIDPSAEEPIMLIDKHIGFNSEEGEGIMGDKFSKELLFLDTLNKSKIHVWINSPGGSVIDGLEIVSSILKTKTKVDTHNLFLAASIAFPIWLAGRSRYMMDFAKGMVHPVHGGADQKTLDAMGDSVLKAICSRTGIDEKTMGNLMARTTWLGASELGPGGFNICNIESSNEFNKPRAVSNNWKDYKVVMNKLIDDKKPKKTMIKVTNRLGLIEGSNEESILKAIDAIENKNSSNEAKINEMKAALDKAEAECKELKAKYDKFMDEAKAKNEAEAKVAAENKAKVAKEAVTNGVKLGKIVNDAKVIERWENLFVADFEGTKSLLESIPASKNAAKITVEGAVEANSPNLTMVAANTMNEIRNNLKL